MVGYWSFMRLHWWKDVEKRGLEDEMCNNMYELHDNYIFCKDTHDSNGQHDPFQYYLMKINHEANAVSLWEINKYAIYTYICI